MCTILRNSTAVSLTEKTLAAAEWAREIRQHMPSCSDLPDETPLGCSRLLHRMAVLHIDGNAISRLMHHGFIWVCMVWAFMYGMIAIVAARTFPLHAAIRISLLSMVLPGWLVWSYEFSKHGNTMSLLHRMCQRQFHWIKLRRTLRLFWIIVPAVVIGVFLKDLANLATLRHEYEAVVFFESALEFMGENMAHHMTNIVILLAHLAASVVNFMFISQIWICHFAGHLHRHNLRCYAGAVDRALEGDLDKDETVSALSHLELIVSGDFIRASSTWVKVALYQILVVSLLLLTFVSLLLRGVAVGRRQTIAFTVVAVVMCVSLLLSLAWPLVRVKHIYEVDMQLALNNPLMMYRSQKYVASQFLTHLKNFEWGFRFATPWVLGASRALEAPFLSPCALLSAMWPSQC